MRTPSPPPSGTSPSSAAAAFDHQRSPPPVKTIASASTSLTALSRDASRLSPESTSKFMLHKLREMVGALGVVKININQANFLPLISVWSRVGKRSGTWRLPSKTSPLIPPTSRFRHSFKGPSRSRPDLLKSDRSHSSAVSSPKRFGALEDKETAELRDDLALAKEEGTASKEVISVLRKQLEAMEKEKETM